MGAPTAKLETVVVVSPYKVKNRIFYSVFVFLFIKLKYSLNHSASPKRPINLTEPYSLFFHTTFILLLFFAI